MRRITLIFFCLLSLYTISGTDLPSYNFKYYNTDNGLSSDNINALFQDRDGFMWIGTNGGLNRYDGARTINYSTEEEALNSFLISFVSQDSLGYLWFGTKDAGLFRYNPVDNKFLQFDKSNGLKDSYVFSCFPDDKNDLWVMTKSGLFSFKANGEEEYDIIDRTEILPKERGVRYVMPCAYGHLLSFSSHSLTVIDHKSGSQRRLLDKRVFIAEKDNEGVLWATWMNHIYKVKEGVLLKDFALQEYPTFLDGKPYEIGEINSMVFDLNGRLWIGTSETGLYSASIDEEKELINLLSHSYLDMSQPDCLSNNMIRQLVVDNTNVLWIGTEGGGVNLLDLEAQDFRNLLTPEEGTNSKVFRSVCEDKNGNLWLGVDASGLYFLPNGASNSSAMQMVKFDDEVLNDVLKSINYIYETQDGLIWVATEGRGLLSIKYDYHSQTDRLKCKLHSSPSYNNGKVSGSSVTAMLEESDGTFWLATYGNGLNRAYRDKQGRISDVDVFVYDEELEQSISDDIVRSLALSPSGELWVGTGRGLNKVLRSTNNDNVFFKRYLAGDNGLTNDYILPLRFTKEGQLWVGTLGGGVFLFRDEDESSIPYGTEQGLANDVVKSILEDDEGLLWISSNNGLSKLDPKSGTIINFSVADGLQGNSFNELSDVKRNNGELLFGGVNGVTAFLPNEIKSNPYKSPVAFTDIKIFNNSVKTGEELNGRVLLSQNIAYTDRLKLSYNENSIEFAFAVLHFSPNHKSHIRYRLEGFDGQWNHLLNNERSLKYTNLPAGKYKLILESYNEVDVNQRSQAQLAIVVKAPIWATVPAYIIYFLLFITLLYLFSRYSLIQNNKKNELLMERLEKQKTEELTQLKLDFFTKISHEFRTPLTLIVGTIESLFGNDQTYSRKRDIIQRNVNTILRLTRQLTDFRKYEQGQLEMKVTQNNILTNVQNVFDSFESLAAQKNITFVFNSEIENTDLWFDADKIEKVLFNLLSNALKFTPTEGEVRVNLSEEKDNNIVTISDTGSGIPNEKQEHIFEMFYRAGKVSGEGSGVGLAFSKNMVEMHKGKLTFESKENIGTSFKLSLKKGKEHYKTEDIYEYSTGGDFILDYNNGREWKKPVAVPQHQSIPKKKDGSQVKVLVVEDQLDVRRFIVEHLENDYQVLEASNGREALDKCVQQLPELVISDVIMPETDGLELCKQIKNNETTKHIPVMLLSARDEVKDLMKGYEYEADAYVTKPFHIQVLTARVASLIKNRQRIINQTVNKVTLEPTDVNISKTDERFLNRAMKVMEKNISNADYHVQDFAGDLGFSAPHLNRKFKKLLDKTTIRFMQEVRLKRAVQLLKLGTSVTDAAYETGYNSVRRFRDSFKEQYGVSPSEYSSSEGENS